MEGPPLSYWNPTRALELWYMDKTRRLNVQDSHAALNMPQAQREEAESEWEEWIDK